MTSNEPEDEAPAAPTFSPGLSATELDAVRRRVLNVIGHELRTPVTTIHGLSRALADADATQVRDEIAPALQRNAARLERLLDDLLVASGISTALPVEPSTPVALAPLVDAVWVSVSGTGDPDAPTVTGDAEALAAPGAARLIVERILDNAARYGEPPLTVAIERDGDRVVMTADSPGPEIHPEEVALATEPFFRGERAVMTGPGIGLGLAVARSLAEHQGGSLRVDPRPGGGLRTVLELPAR